MSMMVQNNNAVDIFDDKKLQLLKDTVCKGSTDDEFQLFVHACKRTGLDPFMKQVHAVKRWDSTLKRESMTIQTGIDGYRLIADRTGNYAPGRETTFVYDKEGRIFSATAYVKKRTPDGTWHEISSTAHFCEYVGKTKDGNPNMMWATKGHIMLGKCAEALALRKAFPAELSGVYTKEEMEQADNPITINATSNRDALISDNEIRELEDLIADCDPKYKKLVIENLSKLGIVNFSNITMSLYQRIKTAAVKKRDEFMMIQNSSSVEELVEA